MKETIAQNLIRYRKGLRLSQDRLAEQVGLTRQVINNYENAKTLPDSKDLSRLADQLGITLDDLLRPLNGPPDTGHNFCFRAHSSFAKKPQFACYIENLLTTYTALEMAVGFAPYAPETTPCDRVQGNEQRIQQIAEKFRARLGFGNAPLPNLFEAVEEIGLKVLRLPIEQKDFFGVSACSATQGAFILINTHHISIERQLFTLAHEIGHLIFHRDEYRGQLLGSDDRAIEKGREQVADYFASYLLISQVAFDQARHNMQNDWRRLKAHFRVSYQTILKRFDELGIEDYGSMIKNLRFQYNRRTGSSLTNDIELEPRLQDHDFPLNQRYKTLIWQALEQEKISESKAAELLGLTIEDLRLERQQMEVFAVV